MDEKTELKALAGYEYSVIRSDRRSFGMQMRGDGSIKVLVPRRAPHLAIERFAADNIGWVEKQTAKLLKKRTSATPVEPLTEEELKQLHSRAKKLFPERCEALAPLVGVTYGRITIRTQRSKWGSCTATGNLNFNCLLLLMPGEVIDYVVVHELCHRLQMNHSKAFWDEVRRVLPDYEKPKKWLKEHGDEYMLRLGA